MKTINILKKPMTLKRAALINATFKYAAVILQLGVTAILARILTPEDYGIIAVVTVFINFFSIFSEMGLGAGIIQDKTLSEKDISNIFSLTIYLGIILSGIFLLCAYPISLFYGDSRYVSVCLLLSIPLLLNTWSVVPRAVMMKEKRFLFTGIADFLLFLLGSTTGIICALNGLSYYSLVIQGLPGNVISFILFSSVTGMKFDFKPWFSSAKKILGISAYQFAFNFVNYFARNLDNLLTGKFMGASKLAFYEKGYRLTLYPVQNLTHVITPVLHPILSDFQNDKRIIYNKYIKLLNLLSIMGVFITAVCFFCTREIILILFGGQWEPSVNCFKWLSLSIWVQMVTSSVGGIFQSLGNTKNQFISGTINAVVIILLTLLGVCTKDIEFLSICVMTAYFIASFISFYMLIKCSFNYSIAEFYKSFKIEFIGFVILFLTGSIFNCFFDITNIFAAAAVKVSLLSLVYLIYLIATKRISFLLSFVKRKK